MTSPRFLATVLSCTALLAVVTATAHADGMPYGFQPQRQQALTPLDQALDQLQGPSDLVAEDDDLFLDVEEEQQIVEPTPSPPVVPESRVVQVQENTSFFGLSVGLYDAFTHGEKAGAFNIEWQPGTRIAGLLQPLFGAMVTTDGTLLGYGGLGVPFNVTENILLMPSVALGYYKEGRGVDLDSNLAVRYGAEIAYQFENKSRVGLNAHVISNGKSFESKDRTEVISVVYTTPTNMFSGASTKPADYNLNARMTPPRDVATAAAAVEPAAGGDGLRIPPGMRINR